jgi:hypothetical protein
VRDLQAHLGRVIAQAATIEPPPHRPTDECLALMLRLESAGARIALWDEIKGHWPRYTSADQKRLLEGHARAKARLGG